MTLSRRSLWALVGLSLALLGCGRRSPRVQPIVPTGELAQRSFLPSDPRLEARQAIADRLARRERAFRELYEPGSFWQQLRLEQADIDAGRVPLPTLIEIGRELFFADFTPAQGLGNGLARLNSPIAGKRPAPNLRHVHFRDFGAPDGTRCVGCHHVGGQAGGGGRSDNSFLDGDGDRPESGLDRNPRALLGAALLERLADEMSAELHTHLNQSISSLGRGQSVPLTAKGVSFGVVRMTRDGRLDLTGIHGVSLDLVVRPFGWKGTSASLRQMVVSSLQQNLGIQADELVERAGRSGALGTGPRLDPDADGISHEATRGMVTALTAYLASVAPPIEEFGMDPVFLMSVGKGKRLFDRLGCAECHTPELPLQNTVISLGPTPDSQPQVDLAPLIAGSSQPDKPRKVQLYSDLRRHNMGDALSETRGYLGIPRHQWMTPPLWGVAVTQPYLHDGRAGSLHEAILAHGGEAQTARDAYEKLSVEEGAAVRLFLISLTRPAHLEFRP